MPIEKTHTQQKGNPAAKGVDTPDKRSQLPLKTHN